MNGSEGRKDPACSLYNHLEVAPEIVYYDFACSLKEYCMNREAGISRTHNFFPISFMTITIHAPKFTAVKI